MGKHVSNWDWGMNPRIEPIEPLVIENDEWCRDGGEYLTLGVPAADALIYRDDATALRDWLTKWLEKEG